MRRLVLLISLLSAVSGCEKDTGCGSSFANVSRGIIQTPNYPLHYSHYHCCKWTIEVEESYVIRLSFNGTFDLPNFGRKGSWGEDSLKVYEYPQVGERVLRHAWSGTSVPPDMMSVTSKLLLDFQSNFLLAGKGFSILWSKEVRPPHLFPQVGQKGSFSSPNYPSTYSGDVKQRWEIIAPVSQFIALEFPVFDLGSTGFESCDKDSIEIFDVVKSNNSLIRLGQWCGNDRPPPITSSGSRLFVDFYSDYDNTMNGQGFSATWSSNWWCGGTHTTDRGVLSTTNYPYLYDNDDICKWTIEVSDGYLVTLNFLPPFELENNTRCTRDFVTVLDVLPSGSRRWVGTWCGSNWPPPLTSSSSKFDVEFRSNYRDVFKGFSLAWSKVGYKKCQTGYCSCGAGFIQKGRRCVDIDECVFNNGGCEHTCKNTLGSWKCSCHHGYAKIGPECTYNRCFGDFSTNSGRLEAPNLSGWEPKTYSCEWIISVERGSGIQLDINPSDSSCFSKTIQFGAQILEGRKYNLSDPHWCVAGMPQYKISSPLPTIFLEVNITDVNSFKGFSASWSKVGVTDCTRRSNGNSSCSCRTTEINMGDSCLYAGNCDLDYGSCYQMCTNWTGSSGCSCYYGNAKNWTFCNDVDKCDVYNGGCDELFCSGITGLRNCSCYAIMDGLYHNSSSCNESRDCMQDTCPCGPDQIKDGDKCIDKNACAVNNGGCDHICTSVAGYGRCTCYDGYRKNGTQCTDIDECATDNGGCSQICTNMDGYRTCSCRTHFTQNGTDCIDIDECAAGSNGGCDQTCTNTIGGWKCSCHAGYDTYGGACLDINECKKNYGGCDQICVNTPGSWNCACHIGYSLSGNKCVYSDEGDLNKTEPPRNEYNSNTFQRMNFYLCFTCIVNVLFCLNDDILLM